MTRTHGPLTLLSTRSRQFWIVVAVAIPVLYVGSFGPWCWIAARTGANDSRTFSRTYTPLWWAINRHVPVVAPALKLYALVGIQGGGVLRVPSQNGDYWEECIYMD